MNNHRRLNTGWGSNTGHFTLGYMAHIVVGLAKDGKVLVVHQCSY